MENENKNPICHNIAMISTGVAALAVAYFLTGNHSGGGWYTGLEFILLGIACLFFSGCLSVLGLIRNEKMGLFVRCNVFVSIGVSFLLLVSLIG